MLKRVIIDVSGIVQGVGFRPFVYTIAKELDLKGFVLNNGHGVHIEIEGTQQKLNLFLTRLQDELPPLAQIDKIKKVHKKPQGDRSFVIQESNQSQKTALISPDMSICDQCLAELYDPHDRRYHYFASNCTHCGPRYSIIETVPYDRASTSMKFFTMCQACNREYHDPLDRRYHAQPISCYDCGPTLTLYDAKHQKIDSQDLIKKVATLFNQGAIIAVKGLGGFHLMCDGYNYKSVTLLRQGKNRPLKPLALLFPTDMKPPPSPPAWLRRRCRNIQIARMNATGSTHESTRPSHVFSTAPVNSRPSFTSRSASSGSTRTVRNPAGWPSSGSTILPVIWSLPTTRSLTRPSCWYSRKRL